MFARIPNHNSPIQLQVKCKDTWIPATKNETGLPESQMQYLVEWAYKNQEAHKLFINLQQQTSGRYQGWRLVKENQVSDSLITTYE